MKFNKLDTVSVLSGKYAGQKGIVVGFSQVHRNAMPDEPEYQVAFRDLKITEEFLEQKLVLIEKYDEEKAERERKEKIAQQKAEQERLADEKMEQALRKKIEKELELREKIEKEFAEKKKLASQ